ncbi:lysozyme inhibitor LprI family protein [Pseudomonas oryzae]|uniref:Uncharacterized conserved protein YecT, DUF1311 family n=1 Tax=Pseudomonas oryzae TaxID=1392877 RepID=A0A1H1LNR3_9PSED|nr:lysozyme inhibitor LprI family protein [Pseudomonas oryzae]SDR76234.1 Uncharacterized conserved protein YecT, DUF1311 family [Pseudomonas oryzae]
MKKIYSLSLLIIAHPTLGDIAKNPCERIESSQQVAQCAEYRRHHSDSLLNSSYKATLARIKNQYKNTPSLADQYISLLREAQREWIKLRDADCKLEAFEIEETTEAYQTTINNCVSRISEDRAIYLNSIAPEI